MVILEGAVLVEGDDSWAWRHSLDGNYSACSAYGVLSGADLVSGERSTSVVNSVKLVWNSWPPSKVQVFSWQLILDRFPSHHNLLKRRVLLDLTSAHCQFYRSSVEFVDHLFVTCGEVFTVWYLVCE